MINHNQTIDIFIPTESLPKFLKTEYKKNPLPSDNHTVIEKEHTEDGVYCNCSVIIVVLIVLSFIISLVVFAYCDKTSACSEGTHESSKWIFIISALIIGATVCLNCLFQNCND